MRPQAGMPGFRRTARPQKPSREARHPRPTPTISAVAVTRPAKITLFCAHVHTNGSSASSAMGKNESLASPPGPRLTKTPSTNVATGRTVTSPRDPRARA